MNEAIITKTEILTEVKQNDKINLISNSIQDLSKNDKFGFESNQDICFKCKKVGQIYCCDNCFRSFHWKCIGQVKIKQLTESSYVKNFVCQSCDQQNNCVKCNSIYPKQCFNLLDFSQDRSIFSIYKCTHCYSKIHKKCLDIPMQLLNKKLFEKKNNSLKATSKAETFQHYICSKCLQNVGITEIITTQRICNNLGIENLYYYVLLNTHSPIHKGWVEEFVLRNHLKKFSGNQTFISEFLKNSKLYENPQIQKILAIRFPAKFKKTSIGQVQKIIQSKSKQSLNDRYGDPDNFKFLVKWKYRDYTSLTWQDQTVTILQQSVLKQFLTQKQNQFYLIDYVNQIQVKRNRLKQNNETNYKLLEYYLNNEPKITSRFLLKKQQIDLFNKSQKKFQQKMIELDQKNQNSYLQIVSVQNTKINFNNVSQHRKLLMKYLQKRYHSQIILRPTLIISDNLLDWQQTITHSKTKAQSPSLNYIKFQGTKLNTDSIKMWDFFISKNPTLLKFHIVLIDYNYFLYQNKYLFQNIPSFLITIFDQSDRFQQTKQRLKYIQKTYIQFKSKVYKEIYLIQNSLNLEQRQSFIMSLLNINKVTKNPIKKCVYNDINFLKIKQYVHSQSNLKLKLEKRWKDSTKIFDNPSKQILNQGQRLSFLKFIMAFGLNIKKIDDMCNRMRTSNPAIWNIKQNKRMTEMVKDYISLFMAVISNNSKELPIKNYQTNLNYFLFNYQKETVLKRIIQLKKLKTQVQKSFDDHSKFVIKKPFMFFSSGQCKPFPLWNTYEDYTLGALIVQEGYEMWDNVINSKKWIDYHSQLETRKIYQLDPKTGTFSVQQKIVPIKKKILHNSLLSEERIIQHISHKIFEESKFQISKSQDTQSGRQQIIQTYGKYLLKKIRGSKQFKEFQYARLDDLTILQGHIAQRGDSILLSLAQN